MKTMRRKLILLLGLATFLFLPASGQPGGFTRVAEISPAGPVACWGDYDNDGDLDVLVTGEHSAVLMQNNAGVFVNSGAHFPNLYHSFASWADYDNDNDLDLLLSGDVLPDGPSYVTSIYNNNNGVFTDINANLLNVRMACADWGDYDNDGDLDLVITGHEGNPGVAGFSTRLYRNDPGGFTELDIGLPGVRSGAIAWGDFDNDSYLDLVIAGPTDCHAVPAVCNQDPFAEIYRNNSGNGTFSAINAGLAPQFKATSAAWGDYDNDNDEDLVIMGQSQVGSTTGYTTRLYKNTAGAFTEVVSGLPNGRGNPGAIQWGDFDNDGDLDILISGDSGPSYFLAVYVNNAGTFSLFTGLTPVTAGAVSWGDIDGDGDLDILASGYNPITTVATSIFRNNLLNATPGLLPNPGFEGGTAPWSFYTNGSAAFTNNGTGLGSPHAARVAISSAGTNTQMFQKNIQLDPVTVYRLSFAAYSTGGHGMVVTLHSNTPPYTNYGVNRDIALSKSWQCFTVDFVTQGFFSLVDDARLRFSFSPFAAAGESYYIDNVLLERVAGTSPVFTSHPEDKTVYKFQTATFNITAAGAPPLSYQWQRNAENILGATNVSYTTPEVGGANDGDRYRCVVTNPFGTAYSNEAVLHVLPAINFVQNPGFESGTQNWSFYTNGAGTFATYPHTNDYGVSCAGIIVSTAGTNVQLAQSGVFLEPNTTYQLKFVAYSNTGHNVAVFLHRNSSPYTNYGVNGWIADLTTGWQSFAKTFTTPGFGVATSDTRLRFWFAPYDAAGDQFFVDDVWLGRVGPGKDATPAEQPVLFALHQNYPNPFNPTTVISYDLPVATRVSLKVYDLLGKEITVLVNEMQDAGFKSVEFDASNLASGMYFYRLRAGDFSDMKKLIVVK